MRENHPGARLLSFEVSNRLCDRTAEDVVRQHHDHTVPAGEVVGEPESLCNPARLVLPGVPELPSEIAAEVVDVVAAGHEDEVLHPGVAEKVHGPLDHRLVADG